MFYADLNQENFCCVQVISEHKGMLQLLIDTKEKKSGSVKEEASQVYEKLTAMVKERRKSTPGIFY